MTTEKSEDAEKPQEEEEDEEDEDKNWKWDEKTVEKDFIKVVTGDGDIVPVHKALLEWSEYANSLYQANNTQITVRLLNAFQLHKVARWISHHRTGAKQYYERLAKNKNRYRHRMNNIPLWDSDFLDVEFWELTEVTKAAAILGIGLLKDFIARKSLRVMANGDVRQLIANFDDRRKQSRFKMLLHKYKNYGKLDSIAPSDKYFLRRKMLTADFTL